MNSTISEVFAWFRRQMLGYLTILAILIAGGWFYQHRHEAAKLEASVYALRAEVEAQRQRLLKQKSQLPVVYANLQRRTAELTAIYERSAAAQKRLESERANYAARHWILARIPGSEAWFHLQALDIQLDAHRRATQAAREVKDFADPAGRSSQSFDALLGEAKAKRDKAQALRAERRRVSADSDWLARLRWTDVYKKIERLDEQIVELEQAALQVEARLQALASASKLFPELAALIGLQSDIANGERNLATSQLLLSQRVADLRDNVYQAMQQWVIGAWTDHKAALWIAAGILVLAIGGRVALKVLLYYMVAPMAARCDAIQLIPASVEGAHGRGARYALDAVKTSATSVRLHLSDNEEVLVLPEYLQSSSLRAQKKTQWFLNTTIPYSCLLSGMFMLTRVQSPGSDEVVLSATKDPLSELCVLELPEGAAFVCQPRSLAGVVQYQGRPIRISRHWRLWTLQSWVTMQLRYLVFHGPGKLVIKGCRGVLMERAGRGRLINQAATLGFDAHLAYSNTRCETFVSYLRGKDNLFNDLFTGDGSYVYEEVPDLKHKSGVAGRGLEGIGDAVLKVFGA